MVPPEHSSIANAGEQEKGMVERSTVPSSPFSTSLLLRRGVQVLIIGVPVVLLALFVLYPLAAIILQSIFPQLFASSPSLVPSLDALKQVFANSENYLALFNSLWQSSITALLAALLGTTLAILARRTDLPFRGAMDILVWIVFFTPSFLIGEAWSLVFIRGGIPDQYLHFSLGFINWFFSPVGVIFILSLKTFPYVYLSVSAALQWLGAEFEDAARLAGARIWRSWLSINAPLLLPAILAAALIAFAEALSDFGTAATIAQNSNVTLVTYQISTAINTAPVNFSLAAALSLLLFLAIALALLLQAGILHTRSFQVISGRNRPARPVALGRWKWPAISCCILVFLIALVIPLGTCLILSLLHAFGLGLTTNNWTLDNYTAVLAQGSDDLDALMRTFWLALGTATITTLVGLPIAFIIRRTQIPGRRLLSLFTLVTIAVPGIILACGYIFAWNAPYLQYIGIGGAQGIPFYGTIWILLAAYIGGSLPYATRLGIGALDQVGQNLLDTARVQGANLFQLLASIVGPLLRSNLTSIWLLVFTGTMFELAASELLYPPGEPTMSVRIVSLFNDFKLGPGMALSMLNIGIVALALILLRTVPWLIGRVIQHNTKRKTTYVSTDQAVEQELRITAGLLNVGLTMEEGEILTLLGPSGCGKTTILRMIAGLVTPDSGEIKIGDRVMYDGTHEVPVEERRLGMVFQDYALWPHMTVTRNIAFGLRLRRAPGREIAARVQELLELVNLPGLGDRYPYQLSGGQQQRVSLARALATEPRVLLLDEPLSSLDTSLREVMRTELARLFKRLKITAINVTHDQDEAMTMSDRIMVLRDGVVQQVGTPTELYLHPANVFVASFMGPANLFVGEIEQEVPQAGIISLHLKKNSPEELIMTGVVSESARDRLNGHKRAELLCRLDDIRFHQEMPHLEHANLLSGTVTHTSFVGGRWRTLVMLQDIPGQPVLAFPPFQPQVERQIWLELPPERCQVVPV